MAPILVILALWFKIKQRECNEDQTDKGSKSEEETTLRYGHFDGTW